MQFSKYMLTKDYSTHNAHSEQDMIISPQKVALTATQPKTTFSKPCCANLPQAFTYAKQHKWTLHTFYKPFYKPLHTFYKPLEPLQTRKEHDTSRTMERLRVTSEVAVRLIQLLERLGTILLARQGYKNSSALKQAAFTHIALGKASLIDNTLPSFRLRQNMFQLVPNLKLD